MDQDTPKIEYAVIGFYEDNNQIFCYHVSADSAMNAFAQIAASSADGMQGEPVFVAALPVADTGRIEYPGEGLVYEGCACLMRNLLSLKLHSGLPTTRSTPIIQLRRGRKVFKRSLNRLRLKATNRFSLGRISKRLKSVWMRMRLLRRFARSSLVWRAVCPERKRCYIWTW